MGEFRKVIEEAKTLKEELEKTSELQREARNEHGSGEAPTVLRGRPAEPPNGAMRAASSS
jgi:hypothetical protein